MKKFLSIFAGMILSVGMIHATDIITANPVTVTQGETAEIEIVFNDDNIWCKGFQFDLTTPDGVDVVKVDNKISAQLIKMDPEFTISSNQLLSGASRFVVLSFEGVSFSGSESVMKVTCQADEDLAPGEYKGTISGVKVTTRDYQTIKGDDVEFTINVVSAIPDAIKALTDNGAVDGIYNIQGQRGTKPVKGVNIINGVKVLVK